MSELTERVARLPWVTRLDETRDCDSYRWNHMPLKALHDPAVAAKWKCRARARWQFRALPAKRSADLAATSGTYCWSHLMVQLHHMNEEGRTRRKLGELRALDGWNKMLLGSAARLAQATAAEGQVPS